MAKIIEESIKDLSLNESDEMEVSANDDIMSDIRPEDYVFVVTQEGVLKGISLPEVDVIASPKVEEIFKFFINREGGHLSSKTLH